MFALNVMAPAMQPHVSVSIYLSNTDDWTHFAMLKQTCLIMMLHVTLKKTVSDVIWV